MIAIVALLTLMLSGMAYATASDQVQIQHYQHLAEQYQLDQQITWQRLMYVDEKGKSEISYAGYFLAAEGRHNLKQEMQADIAALFSAAEPDQSIRCKFPARSRWLMQQLQISEQQLPVVQCPQLADWIGQIKPYKATLIYATDFMGNPSSMFGHTLLRLDPKDQKQLNLVSYAVNYAATVHNQDNWAYAWKGLTGQYPGEYSLMPYYRKVKEYGDFESRDLWEYELNLSSDETRFLVEHIWEMQQVSFPYYFVSDNCAYRLLGLIDLVRPEANLQQQFKHASIPMQTLKAMQQQGLVKDTVYRPALETQLLSQARQHGHHLAQVAHKVAFAQQSEMASLLAEYAVDEQAKILEMAYDDLYLQFVARQVETAFAQPRLRQLLSLRSQLAIERQRQEPQRPAKDPTQGHDARMLSLNTGTVQGDSFFELGQRQAYHDLLDPQAGYRFGTQLLFLQGNLQVRKDALKLEQFDLLSVNAYNPVQPFKTPLSWGFNFSWQQEAVQAGQFSEHEQHGVVSVQTQLGYSWADYARQHLCYAQLQSYVQAGKNLERGWRFGMGPTLGCMNQWSPHWNSLVQVELPYWEDQQQWNLRLNTQLQYSLNANHALRLNGQFEQQQGKEWSKVGLGYARFF